MQDDIQPMWLDFDEVADLLLAEEALNASPAELQGWLTGLLVAGARMSPDSWLQEASSLLDLEAWQHAETPAALVTLYEQTLAHLESAGLSYQLLLPDDQTDLAVRVDALGIWCQGFMSGFGAQGRQTDQSLSQEAKDVLNDLAHIAQVESDVEQEEEGEGDLMELQEYVRMAALMLFAECNASAPASDKGAQALH